MLSHGGGFLPSYIGRADNCYARSRRVPDDGEDAECVPEGSLLRHARLLAREPRNLIEQVGADRLVLGTDYPFPIASQDPVGDALAVHGLSDAQVEAILGGTALKLLGV